VTYFIVTGSLQEVFIMRKLLVLSFVSFFIGLISLVFYTSQASALPPFNTPDTGGLPACTMALNTSNDNLSICYDDLAECEAVVSLGVPQTGQTTCWNSSYAITNCTGTGQDGDLQAGVVPPDPRFTDNGDGTITDNLTGLIWLQDAHCDTGPRSWDQAFANVAELNSSQTMGGETCDYYTAEFTDWRLPNINELASLIDYGVSSGSVLPSPNFMNFVAAPYWSSTTVAITNNQDKAWIVWFDNGSVSFDTKTTTHFVTAVRGGS
jgi:hypothetical protein